MLIGQYEHSIDEKNRMNFPARLREILGEQFILTVGIDECVAVYSLEEWARFEEKIKNLPVTKSRDVKRYFFSNATQAEPDKQGRILVPNNLRNHAHLKKDLLVAGVGDHAEIWDLATWNEKNGQLSSSTLEEELLSLDF